MNWDEDYIEAGDEEKQFTSRLLLTGNKVGAAKGTIVPPNAPNAVAAREADKALSNPGVQAHVLALMAEAGATELDIVKTFVRNLTARKMGIVQKTGEVVDLGEDGMTQIQSGKMLGTAIGWFSGGAPRPDTEKVPPKYELHFHNHEAPIDEEGDIDGDVIEGEYTASTD